VPEAYDGGRPRASASIGRPAYPTRTSPTAGGSTIRARSATSPG